MYTWFSRLWLQATYQAPCRSRPGRMGIVHSLLVHGRIPLRLQLPLLLRL
jgi:hypothetical protein